MLGCWVTIDRLTTVESSTQQGVFIREKASRSHWARSATSLTVAVHEDSQGWCVGKQGWEQNLCSDSIQEADKELESIQKQNWERMHVNTNVILTAGTSELHTVVCFSQSHTCTQSSQKTMRTVTFEV